MHIALISYLKSVGRSGIPAPRPVAFNYFAFLINSRHLHLLSLQVFKRAKKKIDNKEQRKCGSGRKKEDKKKEKSEPRKGSDIYANLMLLTHILTNPAGFSIRDSQDTHTHTHTHVHKQTERLCANCQSVKQTPSAICPNATLQFASSFNGSLSSDDLKEKCEKLAKSVQRIFCNFPLGLLSTINCIFPIAKD